MNAIFVIVVLQTLIIINENVISAKKHSKSVFRSEDYGISSDGEHEHDDENDNNDDDNNNDDDDDDNHHHNDHHEQDYHKSTEVTATKPINVHVKDDHHMTIVKNPSKKVLNGNTISQFIAYKQFLANSMFNLMTRPARKVAFRLHFSKKTHPKTVHTPKEVVYTGEKEGRDNPSIVIETHKHGGAIKEASDEKNHKSGLNYHNFYDNVGNNNNWAELYGHHQHNHQYYYPNL